MTIKISKRKKAAIEKAICRINKAFTKAHYQMNTLQQTLRDLGMKSVVVTYHCGDELCLQDGEDGMHGVPEDIFTLDELIEYYNAKENGEAEQ